jgi:hypothetical protein
MHDEYSPQPAWPLDTELVLSPGSNKLMLTSQRPIVRAVIQDAVIQDAIDNLWAAMLFTNAFPDVCVALGLIKDCLLTAANRLKPGAKEILERLEQDQDYMLKITPLVIIFLLRDDFTDSPFQPRADLLDSKRSEGALQYHHHGVISCLWLGLGCHQLCYQTTGRLYIHLSTGQCKSYCL